MIRAGAAARAVVAVLRGLARLFDGFLLAFLGLLLVVLLRLLRLVLRVFLRLLGFLRRAFDDLALLGFGFSGFAFLCFLRLVGLRRLGVGLYLIAVGIGLVDILAVLVDALDEVAVLVGLRHLDDIAIRVGFGFLRLLRFVGLRLGACLDLITVGVRLVDVLAVSVGALDQVAVLVGLLLLDGVAVRVGLGLRLLGFVLVGLRELLIRLLRLLMARIVARVVRDLLGVALHRIRYGIVLIREEDAVEPDDIGLKCRRDDAGALLAHHLILQVLREADGLADVVAGDALRELDDVGSVDVKGHLREHGVDDLREGREVGLLCEVEALRDDFTLALRTLEIAVHVAEAGVSHGLDAVQVLRAGVLDVHGGRVLCADAGLQAGFVDVGIHIVESRLRDVDVHAAEEVDDIRHGLPVEGDVILDIEVEVFIQHRDGLLRSALGVGGVTLRVAVPLSEIQVGITVDGGQGDITGAHVDVRDDLYIGVRALADVAVTGVDTEDGDGPVAGHLLLLGDVDVVVSYLADIEGDIGGHVHVAVDEAEAEDADEGQELDDHHGDDAGAAGLLLFVAHAALVVGVELAFADAVELADARLGLLRLLLHRRRAARTGGGAGCRSCAGGSGSWAVTGCAGWSSVGRAGHIGC